MVGIYLGRALESVQAPLWEGCIISLKPPCEDFHNSTFPAEKYFPLIAAVTDLKLGKLEAHDAGAGGNHL